MHRGVTRFTAVALLGLGCVGTSGPGTPSSAAGLSPFGVGFAAPSKLRPWGETVARKSGHEARFLVDGSALKHIETCTRR